MLTTSASRGGAARTHRETAAFPAPWSNRPLRITTCVARSEAPRARRLWPRVAPARSAVAAAKRGARLIALMALSRGPPAGEVAFTALTGEVEHRGNFFQGLVGAAASDSLTARWQPPVPPTNPPELCRRRRLQPRLQSAARTPAPSCFASSRARASRAPIPNRATGAARRHHANRATRSPPTSAGRPKSAALPSAREAANAIRAHWAIENREHYVSDSSFAENASRIRKNAGIFARIRSFAVNILRLPRMPSGRDWKRANQ
jgi:hypothetical protein